MALLLIRHAKAGKRDDTSPEDVFRPLDEKGVLQAKSLVSMLKGEPVDEVYSSRATRCVDTVKPLAKKRGLKVVLAEELFEGVSSAEAIEFVRSFTKRNVVLCSHGDVIPDVLRTLRLGGTHVSVGGFPKSSVWKLDNSTERIESADYLGKPEI